MSDTNKKFVNPLKIKKGSKNYEQREEFKYPDSTPVHRLYKLLKTQKVAWEDLSDYQWYLMYKCHPELLENDEAKERIEYFIKRFVNVR